MSAPLQEPQLCYLSEGTCGERQEERKKESCYHSVSLSDNQLINAHFEIYQL
jgi:hypothetical protein